MKVSKCESVHMYICMCMYICICLYVYACICMYMDVYVHVCIYVCVYEKMGLSSPVSRCYLAGVGNSK